MYASFSKFFLSSNMVGLIKSFIPSFILSFNTLSIFTIIDKGLPMDTGSDEYIKLKYKLINESLNIAIIYSLIQSYAQIDILNIFVNTFLTVGEVLSIFIFIGFMVPGRFRMKIEYTPPNKNSESVSK